VSTDTRAIVIEAARRLDYRPNLEARKLGRRNAGIARNRVHTKLERAKSQNPTPLIHGESISCFKDNE
jgi:DNA-binding LacI/PurR family transcriptional regulator